MSGLKYGLAYILKGEILEALGLPLDVHLEVLNSGEEGVIEFRVVANESVEHECLAKMPSHGIAGMRRFYVPLNKDKTKESSEVLDKLSSIIEYYKIESESEVLRLLSDVSVVAKHRDVSYDDLYDALYRVSLLGSESLIFPRDVIHYASLVLSTTRESGVAIGNFLKTVFTRIKEDDIEKLLENEIFYYMNDYNPIGQIASSWSNLEQKTKEKIAQEVAGDYHVARFMVLMNELNK